MPNKYATWRPADELWDDILERGVAADELFDDVVQDRPCHPATPSFRVRAASERQAQAGRN